MKFDILTLFPEIFAGPLTESIIKRAVQAGIIDIAIHNIRDWGDGRHKTVDDTPFGGGAGMLMKPGPLAAAIRAVTGQRLDVGDGDSSPQPPIPQPLVIYLSPDGQPFTQRVAEELVGYHQLVLVCGRYEGIDERVRETLIDRELSVGDFVLTGGELGAMIVLDVVARLVPGVLDAASPGEESFGDGLLEYPQYTRPAAWQGQDIPAVLRSGNHAQVETWRRQQRLARTLRKRPDLLATANLSTADISYLHALGWKTAPN
ncbi:MAG: tRNA (guanosine(37)-N1)-methyltransferase TrmD [Roseiflexaceae bacterium]|nr:tRNA (guanosine(37)-N1)-methyltransferase TrmD [Roseiflexaceae bacterium]